jgi:uncharacterized protein (DUF58 family)
VRLVDFFRRVYLLSRWFERRVTPAGAVVAATALAAGMLGVDTRLSLAHIVFGVTVGLALVGFVARGRFRPALEITRRLPPFVTVGTPVRYAVSVRNRSRSALAGLALEECLRQSYPTAAEFARRRTHASNWFDRAVGYPDWIDWLRRLRAVEIAPVAIPQLEPGQAAELALELRPVHRGTAVFESFGVSRGEPLGLWRALRDVATEEALVVLPRIYPVEWPAFAGSRHHQPGGISLASRVGDSEEFRALRDYRPGDPLRAIHWRSWARTGHPVVKEHQEEYFARHALVLDTAAAAAGELFEAAVSVAASFAVAQRGADSLLDLLFVGAETHCITAGRGLGSTDSLLRVLAGVRPSPPESFGRLAQAVTAHAAAISSAILVLQGWDDDRARLVSVLGGLGIGVRIYVVAEGVPEGPAHAFPPSARWVLPDAIREALARP